MSLRDQILTAQDLPAEQFPIPEWGCTVEVRGMSGTQRSEFLARFFDSEGKPTANPIETYPHLVAAHVFDPATGERVFTEDDAEALSAKSAAILELLAGKALSLSALQPKAVADAAKKSEALPSDGSTSTSAGSTASPASGNSSPA
jgi:hypothetical protein